jgi:hypothetical protein
MRTLIMPTLPTPPKNSISYPQLKRQIPLMDIDRAWQGNLTMLPQNLK